MPAKNTPKSFWARVSSGNADVCWPWTGKIHAKGYGVISWDGRNMRTHRVAYELVRGAIPEGQMIDHTCRNRACCNPGHLRAVTAKINSIENSEGIAARNSKKTHCPKGHPYSGDNVYVELGHRRCRACCKARKDIRNARRYKSSSEAVKP